MVDLARGVCRTRGGPPELRCRGGEALRALRLASGLPGLPDRTLTVRGFDVSIPSRRLKWDRYESGSLAYAHA